jgi:hypothetical protein
LVAQAAPFTTSLTFSRLCDSVTVAKVCAACSTESFVNSYGCRYGTQMIECFPMAESLAFSRWALKLRLYVSLRLFTVHVSPHSCPELFTLSRDDDAVCVLLRSKAKV